MPNTQRLPVKFIILVLFSSISSCISNKKTSDEAYNLVFKEVNLFDGNELHPNATVYVSKDIILKIEKNSPIKLRKDVVVIDGKGKTLIPALINAHVHIGKPQHLVEAAQAGVLTVIDMFNINMASIQTYDDFIGYAQFVSAGICVTAPYGHGTQYGVDIPTLDSVEDSYKFIADRKAEGSNFIKIIIENGYPLSRFSTLSDTTFNRVIAATKQLDMISVVHVSDLDDGIKAFRYGANGLAHLWTKNGKTISKEQLQVLSSRPFFVIPTLQVLKRALNRSKRKPSIEYTQLKNEVAKLHANKVQILAGTDPPNFGINYGTDLYKELEDFVAAGLTPTESLRTATSSPAKAFQLEKVGTIQKGKWANLILIDGDPTKNISDIEKIEGIWQKGQRIK